MVPSAPGWPAMVGSGATAAMVVQATAAGLSNPSQRGCGPDGSLYIADSGNERIRKVTPDGTISTVAGNGTSGYSGDGGPATAARLNNPLAWRSGLMAASTSPTAAIHVSGEWRPMAPSALSLVMASSA